MCLFSSTTSQRPKNIHGLVVTHNVSVKKRGIGKKLVLTRSAVSDAFENVDLMAGDFNGAAWRCDNMNNISIIEEAFVRCALPMPPGTTPLWGPRIDSWQLG